MLVVALDFPFDGFDVLRRADASGAVVEFDDEVERSAAGFDRPWCLEELGGAIAAGITPTPSSLIRSAKKSRRRWLLIA